jgi:hypothetical protein
MSTRILSLIATATFLSPMFLGAQAPEPVTMPGIITGKMNITFKSRTDLDDKGKPAKGALDTYDFVMNVAQTTEYAGKITRQPQLTGDMLGRVMQPAQLVYSMDLAVLNPTNLAQKKTIGKWVGTVPISTTGEYQLAGLPDSQHRIAVEAIGKAQAFTEKFDGKLTGKGKKTSGVMAYVRQFQGKEVKVEVKNSDPMRFDNIVLAAGPSLNYPRTTVNGNLDYDYETGNWYTNGIRFKYNINGVDVQDVVTGSIKWDEDENRATNGKGYYDFNLRFNEDKNKSMSTEADAFASLSDEEAFFAVDNSVPSLTGRVSYEDTFVGGGSSEDPIPAASKVTYALDANRLTKQQAVNFFKLWMICVGPTNDE